MRKIDVEEYNLILVESPIITFDESLLDNYKINAKCTLVVTKAYKLINSSSHLYYKVKCRLMTVGDKLSDDTICLSSHIKSSKFNPVYNALWCNKLWTILSQEANSLLSMLSKI